MISSQRLEVPQKTWCHVVFAHSRLKAGQEPLSTITWRKKGEAEIECDPEQEALPSSREIGPCGQEWRRVKLDNRRRQ